MTTERLFITINPFTDMVMLKDSNGFLFGMFNTVADAETWCRGNGYRYNGPNTY